MRKSVFIYTFGCQMNVHDSEKMLGVLADHGYAKAAGPDEADLIIFNTCAIREKAEQKFYSRLGRIKLLKRKRAGVKIAVAGCVAQEAGGRIFEKAPYVDFLLGPRNIHRIHELVSDSGRQALLEEDREIALQEFRASRQGSIKAWVSIMYGCDNYCSYCIVPYTRGREVSRPSSSILSEVRELKMLGYKEITLLGQNVNSYRSDTDFPGLLRKIDSLGIPRVRFVTSHPRDLSLDLIEAIAELPGVCEHLHLPLQSGSDRVLDMMNRGYTYAAYRKKIDLLRKKVPGIAVTTDIIAGFPGEDDNDHNATLDALRDVEYDGIFAFKFSPREGTKAYCLPSPVGEDVKGARLDSILRVQEEITQKKNRMLEGSTQEVLVEGPPEGGEALLSGRTRTNKIVMFSNSSEPEGSFVNIKIEVARLHSLFGTNTALRHSQA